ncbi:MAG: hypothetical protein IJU49_01255 [Lachnospiraceae bacterium]|nr:hypothetical protein [Lachnospiraceae bacterium]
MVLGLGIGGAVLGIQSARRNNKTFAAFQKLIAAADTSGVSFADGDMKNAAYVRIGDHVARYDRLPTDGTDLSSFLGEFFAEGPSSSDFQVPQTEGNEDCLNSCDCSWYRLKGVQNLQYLLRKDAEGTLSAWKFGLFMSFQEGSWQKLFPGNVVKDAEYGYRERLEVLCQVADAKDVARIEILPSGSSFTASSVSYSEWKEYADKIGTKTINDRRTVTEILEILKGMKDVPGTEDEILKHLHIFRSEHMKDVVETCYLAGELSPVTRYERNVRLVFSDGSSDLLHFTAVSGAFSYSGQQCIELSDVEMRQINELFGIDTEWTLPDGFGEEVLPAGPKASQENWASYSAGRYETPAGTLVICIKRGAEAYEDRFAASGAGYDHVHVRYVKYSRAELIGASKTLSAALRDPDSPTGYSHGAKGFGVSEITNKAVVYLKELSEENMTAILAMAEDPDMIRFIYGGDTYFTDD